MAEHGLGELTKDEIYLDLKWQEIVKNVLKTHGIYKKDGECTGLLRITGN